MEKTKMAPYIIIPSCVRYDPSISPGAKILFGEILVLSATYGYAFATNQMYGSLFDKSKRSISSWVAQLREAKYIIVQLEKTSKGKEVKRRIRINTDHPDLAKYFSTYGRKFHRSIEENCEGNTKINTTSSNNEDPQFTEGKVTNDFI